MATGTYIRNKRRCAFSNTQAVERAYLKFESTKTFSVFSEIHVPALWMVK